MGERKRTEAPKQPETFSGENRERVVTVEDQASMVAVITAAIHSSLQSGKIPAPTAAVVTDASRFESRAPQARTAGNAWAVAGRRELVEGKLLRRGHYYAAG
ncbi:MAG: hypothetical protein ACE5PO_02250 [Candidatus Bathyarchaeia archaeon]